MFLAGVIADTNRVANSVIQFHINGICSRSIISLDSKASLRKSMNQTVSDGLDGDSLGYHRATGCVNSVIGHSSSQPFLISVSDKHTLHIFMGECCNQILRNVDIVHDIHNSTRFFGETVMIGIS